METHYQIYQSKILDSSYPTYEEWKQFGDSQTNLKYIGSYPTYEEWKPFVRHTIFTSSPIQVLILPMRNGNVYFRLSLFISVLVLILPMRNGNFVCLPQNFSNLL